MPRMLDTVRSHCARLRPLLWGCALGTAIAGTAEAARVLVGGNFHTLVSGRVYRCSQPSPERLERLIRDYDIRTVINLRGCCAPAKWYLDECRVTSQRGVSQEDICLSAGRLPSIAEMRRLLDVLDHCEYPVLLHCRRGSDRTGLVSALVLLLQTDVGLDEARWQLGPRFGHIPLGRCANLNRFFDLYEEWLRDSGLTHTPAVLHRWLEKEYCPDQCMATLTLVSRPDPIRAGEPLVFRVRARNTSTKTWHLGPAVNAGVHAMYTLHDDQDHQWLVERAGLFTADVAPGEAIELSIVLPRLRGPARYRLWVDMIDEQQCNFYQAGAEPLEVEFEVP